MALKPTIKAMLGMPRLETGRVDIAVLERDWTFRPSRPGPKTVLGRWRSRHSQAAAPAVQACKRITSRDRWIAYFIYLPDGALTAAHRFTLRRLRDVTGAGLMVICAAPTPADLPAELSDMADALYWKALSGFDFSAFAVAIRETARASPGADLFVLNDSVFGPFAPLDRLWSQMRWDLTGLTASGQVQNHVQSYAFNLKGVDARKVAALDAVFPRATAFDDYRAVVLQQELRLASVAARAMSVGALWYAAPDACADPSLSAALPLVEAGFPFLKRALLSKHDGIYPRSAVLDMLRSLGHPVP